MEHKAIYKRVLIKITGEAMQGKLDFGISREATLKVAAKIKEVHGYGVDVVVVIGGGNIFRGLSASKNGFDRATADYMGMLATCMNALALQDALSAIGVENRVQSALSMPSVAEPYIRRRAIRHMEKGRVVIIAAGTGNPYVSTDTGAALKALELHCDIVIKATKVNGVYTQDPTLDPKAQKYISLNIEEAMSNARINVMDRAALSLCMENNMPILILKLFGKDTLKKAMQGEKVGTMVASNVKSLLASE
jgi:uridylate kinase